MPNFIDNADRSPNRQPRSRACPRNSARGITNQCGGLPYSVLHLHRCENENNQPASFTLTMVVARALTAFTTNGTHVHFRADRDHPNGHSGTVETNETELSVVAR